jgi:3-dehydroquinate synthetase
LTEEEFLFLKESLSVRFEWRTFLKEDISVMLGLMKNDKKNSGDEPEFVLLETLKLVKWSVKVSFEIIQNAMEEILLRD